MYKYIKSSSEFGNGWTPEDIEIYNSIDWKARNYDPYIVRDDSFRGTANLYGLWGGKGYETVPVTFVKFIHANPIYPPYYAPFDESPIKKMIDRFYAGAQIVGPMFDKTYHDGIPVHDRYETQEIYDMSFD